MKRTKIWLILKNFTNVTNCKYIESGKGATNTTASAVIEDSSKTSKTAGESTKVGAETGAESMTRAGSKSFFKSGKGKAALVVGGLALVGTVLFGLSKCSGDDNKQQFPPAGRTDGSSGQSSGAGQSEQPSQPSKPDNSQNTTNPISHKVKSGETYWGHAEADLMTGKLSNLYGNDMTVDSLTTTLMSKNNAEWDSNHYMSKPILKVGDEIKVANYKVRITEKAKSELKAEGKENPTNDEIKAKCKEIKENLLAQIPSSHRSTKLVLNEVSFE